MTVNFSAETQPVSVPEWWRSAVIYQIYPRSFADSNGDGIGDLRGITGRLGDLADLGIDAIWLSPFMTSPQHDAGYDVADYRDVDPLFGTLGDFDAMLATAHDLGIRVIVDLVPNHSSWDHEWFRAALTATPGSPERARYLFRDGRGETGELPPNNWESVFGGGAWTRVTEPDGTLGQWYLHLFDDSQPDFDWTNAEVQEMFRGVLRFWLDRGVDGFRVDVAHGLAKAEGLPDYMPPAGSGSMGGDAPDVVPYWAQPAVHEIYRDWNRVLREYEGDRVLCAEAWVEPLSEMALWVRPDEMHQAFNFPFLGTGWNAGDLRAVITDSIGAFASVGAPSTWVLSNHDVVRHASRLALTAANPQGDGIGPRSAGLPDPVVGLRRGRAATALMLALPGGAYIYQGEELGLPEAIDLPDDSRQDPTWFRTGGERYGRDGCRVPLPWTGDAPSYGFNETGKSWLPQPRDWAPFARDAQRGIAGSTLELYREALRLRREMGLGLGTLSWIENLPEGVLGFDVAGTDGGVRVLANTGGVTVELGDLATGTPLLSSGSAHLDADTTLWFPIATAAG